MDGKQREANVDNFCKWSLRSPAQNKRITHQQFCVNEVKQPLAKIVSGCNLSQVFDGIKIWLLRVASCPFALLCIQCKRTLSLEIQNGITFLLATIQLLTFASSEFIQYSNSFEASALSLFVPGGGGGKFVPTLSYFNIVLTLQKSLALMHPDFKLNLITHIFRNFGVSRITGSDVIFSFV